MTQAKTVSTMLLVSLMLLSWGAPARSAEPGQGPEHIVSAENWNEYTPDVAYNWRDDQFLIVWYERDSSGHSSVLGKIIDHNGGVVAGEFVIGSGQSNDCIIPSVAYDSLSNRYFVTWMYDAPGYGWDIFGALVPAHGLSSLPWPILIERSTSHEYYPQVAFSRTQGPTGSFWWFGRPTVRLPGITLEPRVSIWLQSAWSKGFICRAGGSSRRVAYAAIQIWPTTRPPTATSLPTNGAQPAVVTSLRFVSPQTAPNSVRASSESLPGRTPRNGRRLRLRRPRTSGWWSGIASRVHSEGRSTDASYTETAPSTAPRSTS